MFLAPEGSLKYIAIALPFRKTAAAQAAPAGDGSLFSTIYRVLYYKVVIGNDKVVPMLQRVE